MASITSLADLHAMLVALPEARLEAMQEAALKIEFLIEQEFEAGADSYGKKWADLRPATLDKGRHPPPLTDTGAMRDSVTTQASADGIHITVGGPSHFHQHGTRHMVARKILPEDSLPQSWDQAIQTALDNAVKRRGGG